MNETNQHINKSLMSNDRLLTDQTYQPNPFFGFEELGFWAYSVINIPATPLGFRIDAHFGRVFSFIEHIHRASAERHAKFGGFSFLWGCYGKI